MDQPTDKTSQMNILKIVSAIQSKKQKAFLQILKQIQVSKFIANESVLYRP